MFWLFSHRLSSEIWLGRRKIIIISHLGRPKGNDPELSLLHIVKSVEDVLGKPVAFSKQTVGEETQQIVENSKPGQIILNFSDSQGIQADHVLNLYNWI